MAILPNAHSSFPVANQSTPLFKVSQLTDAEKLKDSDGGSFSQIMKKLSSETSAPSETVKYARSAKATEVREWVLETAATEPGKAEMWAQAYAYHSLNGPLIDVTDEPIVRLSVTGEIYTEEMQGYYEHVRQAMQSGRSALYESEMAKGTPAVKILEKIFAYNDSLPEEFKRIADW